MNQRVVGFDIARAYAIFGMYIVNFNFCFGSVFQTREPVGRFLNLFVGNSTAIFIILAGMGVAFMSNRIEYSSIEKKKLKTVILKRSWFLFALGLALFSWWPGDILHFYGGYMHLAAFLLFVPKKYYILTAIAAILIFHALLFIIPIETSWDFTLYKYSDFWTINGFLRNTLYNGWNAIFPWFAYFALGMWLGRIDWKVKKIRRSLFLIGLTCFIIFQGLRLLAKESYFSQDFSEYLLSEYFPAYLPFMIITASFAIMIICVCMYIGEKFSGNLIIKTLAKTGQMTLSLYVFHLTLGMLILSKITGKEYSGFVPDQEPTAPIYILLFATVFFSISVALCVVWKKFFQNGPIETLMRKVSAS